MKRYLVLAALAIAAVAGLTSVSSTTASANGTGTLNIVHGIPGAVVDVCARGPATDGEWAAIIEDFEFGDIRTFDLPAGSYDANVVGQDAACDSPLLPGLGASGVVLPEGANASVIAHLPESGALADAKLTVGVNDLSAPGSHKSRLTVYHTAAAPAVDIRAGRWLPVKKLFKNVSNGQSGDVEVREGRYKVSVLAAGSKWWKPVTTERVSLGDDTNTVIYAVGSLADGTFRLVPQVIDTEESESKSKKPWGWWRGGDD